MMQKITIYNREKKYKYIRGKTWWTNSNIIKPFNRQGNGNGCHLICQSHYLEFDPKGFIWIMERIIGATYPGLVQSEEKLETL